MDIELSTEIVSIKIEEIIFLTITKLFFNFIIFLSIEIFMHINSIKKKIRSIDWQSFTPDINAKENILKIKV